MPRPTKAFRRLKLQAAAAWKRGERKEAYELWQKASTSLKEHRAKKRTRKQATEAAAAPTSGEAPST